MLVLFFFPLTHIIAVPSFNVADPSILKDSLLISDESFINVRGGFVKAYLQNEQLDFGKNQPVSDLKISGSSSLAKIILNLKERLDIGALIGAETPNMFFKYDGHNLQLNFKENWFYCGRIAATVFEIAKYSFGANFSFYYFKSHTNYFLQDNILYYTSQATFRKKGWQVNIGIEREFGAFSPYIGIAVCKNNALFKNFLFLPQHTLKARENCRIGCFIGSGMSYSCCLLNIEIRLVNETASYFSLDLRF
jgi:hypothetical protein